VDWPATESLVARHAGCLWLDCHRPSYSVSVGSQVLFVLGQNPAEAPSVAPAAGPVADDEYTVTGTAPAGSIISVRMESEQGHPAGSIVQADENGVFSVTVKLDEGDNEIYVRSFTAQNAPSRAAHVTVTLTAK